MYDKNKLQIPNIPVTTLNQNIELNNGVILMNKSNRLVNYSNGGSIELAKHLIPTIENMKRTNSLKYIFSYSTLNDIKEFLSFINYLIRNDYIIVSNVLN